MYTWVFDRMQVWKNISMAMTHGTWHWPMDMRSNIPVFSEWAWCEHITCSFFFFVNRDLICHDKAREIIWHWVNLSNTKIDPFPWWHNVLFELQIFVIDQQFQTFAWLFISGLGCIILMQFLSQLLGRSWSFFVFQEFLSKSFWFQFQVCLFPLYAVN